MKALLAGASGETMKGDEQTGGFACIPSPNIFYSNVTKLVMLR